MDLDEARGIIGIPRYAEYYALSEAEGQPPIIQCGWALVQTFDDDEEHFVSFATAFGIQRWHVSLYGSRWRMWSNNPTEEQKMEAEWKKWT